MPKLPDKIEDWTPPWAEGQLDEDKARGLVYNLERNLEKEKAAKAALRKELTEAEGKIATLEAAAEGKPKDDGAKDARITELTREIGALKKDGRPEDRALIDKYEVALEVGGLSLRDAKRLVGDDRDELVEDATELSQRLSAGSADKGEEESGDGSRQGRAGDGGSNRPVPRGGSLGNGRPRGGEEPKVPSVEEYLKETSAAGQGLRLAPLGR